MKPTLNEERMGGEGWEGVYGRGRMGGASLMHSREAKPYTVRATHMGLVSGCDSCYDLSH